MQFLKAFASESKRFMNTSVASANSLALHQHLPFYSAIESYKTLISVITMTKNKSKFYAVRKGRKLGIYLTWAECEAQVKGFGGAQFKSFKAEADAREYMGESKSSIISQIRGSGSGTTNDDFTFNSNGDVYEQKKSNVDIPSEIALEPFKRSLKNRAGSEPKFEYDQPKIKKRRIVTTEYSSKTKKTDSDREPGTIIIYTDGACSGNSSVSSKIHPAGWGFVVLEKRSGLELVQIHESFGAVILDKKSKKYIGAEVTSNNTAELSAIGFGLQWIIGRHKSSKVVFRYDSEYAAKSAQGQFRNSKKNLKLIEYVQSLLAEARSLGNRFEFQHVKAHAGKYAQGFVRLESIVTPVLNYVEIYKGNRWNDRADFLARRGCQQSKS